MTLDERLEALTQSVELLASMHKDHERRSEENQQALAQSIQSQTDLHNELERRFDEHRRLVGGALEALVENDRKLTEILAGMRGSQNELRDAVIRLSVIAEAHQDRLDDHESRLGPKHGA